MLLQMQNFSLFMAKWYSIVHARVSVCVCVCLYTASSLSIHLLMHAWVVSMSLLLWILLLWALACIYV